MDPSRNEPRSPRASSQPPPFRRNDQLNRGHIALMNQRGAWVQGIEVNSLPGYAFLVPDHYLWEDEA